jgi:hypothetical protein
MSEDLPSIPEDVLLARIEKSEQMREFLIQMWRDNPWLVEKSGTRAKGIMSPAANLKTDLSQSAR